MPKYIFIISLILMLFLACKPEKSRNQNTFNALQWSKDVLNYKITPNNEMDKRGLMFSDQGAWFAYGMPADTASVAGFTGPFLMSQQNGIWASVSLSQWKLLDLHNNSLVDWKQDLLLQTSWNSHLEQRYKNKNFKISLQLVFTSSQTALQQLKITNISNTPHMVSPLVYGQILEESLALKEIKEGVQIHSSESLAKGFIQSKNIAAKKVDSLAYQLQLTPKVLQPQQSESYVIAHHLVFPEYKNGKWRHWDDLNFNSILYKRKKEKNTEIQQLLDIRNPKIQDSTAAIVLAKSIATLQNNWRVAAGELQYAGLFPSYHYRWFHGFWSWDSWKHAVALRYFNLSLAKEQIKSMFVFQNEDGFVADCVYRDTTIEMHNYRDTKPPLAAWAVAKVLEQQFDRQFLEYMYPRLKSYHYWWYAKRDHDGDGLCEYGSTDGTLIAAKWESGMDNAIRFDNAKMLYNGNGAYSMNQESVDLNAYLYAEKIWMSNLAKQNGMHEDAAKFTADAKSLKALIQKQFFDAEDGWFYDTNLSGNVFIKGAGSEGWIPLWANAASSHQAKQIKNRMMNPKKFFTKVPFQTMSADHQKFDPMRGYWRGPNWLDQAYFGIKGLQNYGYHQEALVATHKILNGANGLKEKGKAIHENYHPISGEGLNAKNFSWSAAHIIMLLVDK